MASYLSVSFNFASVEVYDITAIVAIRLLAGLLFAVEISIDANSPHNTALRIVFQRRAMVEWIGWHRRQKLRHERVKRLWAAPRLAPVQFRRDNDLGGGQAEFVASKALRQTIVRG